MTTIMEADPRNPWRLALLPAMFRDAPFFVESSAKSSGRRIVEHEFPKKNIPYSEDMGRRAFKVAVRAYVVQYPSNSNQGVHGIPGYNPAYPLLQRDYRLARDRLEARLLDGQYGLLQLPSPPSVEASQNWQAFTVACDSYQLHEEERYGGYATFDINFVEAGQLPVSSSDWQNTFETAIDNFLSQVQKQMAAPHKLRFAPRGFHTRHNLPKPNPQQSRFNRGQARLR
jgi:hypothetical protein